MTLRRFLIALTFCTMPFTLAVVASSVRAADAADAAAPAAANDAGAAATSGAPASEQDVRKLMEITGISRLMQQMIDQMIGSMSAGMRDVPPEFWTEFRSEIKTGELLDKLVPIYQKNFSQDDIQQLVKFYQSPIGQKLLSKQPAILQESMRVGQQWGRELGQRAAAKIQARQQGQQPPHQ